VIHHNGVAGRTVDDIRRTHTGKGWSDTGYHWIVCDDPGATVQAGRPMLRANGRFNLGAHVTKLNRTIGICLIGNGDKRDFSAEQYAALRALCSTLMLQFGISVGRVVGHRETRPLVPPEFATSKQCPGRYFDLDAFRASLELAEPAA
jgi:hypothetical protein